MKTQVKNKLTLDDAALKEVTAKFPAVSERASRSARFVLGPSREHLVQEVVNDVLLQLWKSHRDGNTPEHLPSWVSTVARNLAYRTLKVENRYAKGLVEEVGNEGAEFNANYVVLSADDLTPSATCEFTERLAAVKKLLDTFQSVAASELNDLDGLLFELYYRRGLSAGIVAEELGLTGEAFRKQWSRLLTKVLETVRAQLNQDPVCADLLSTLLENEKVFRRGLLGLLRVVMQHGVEELERFVRGLFDR